MAIQAFVHQKGKMLYITINGGTSAWECLKPRPRTICRSLVFSTCICACQEFPEKPCEKVGLTHISCILVLPIAELARIAELS